MVSGFSARADDPVPPQGRRGWLRSLLFASAILFVILLVLPVLLYVERRPIAAYIVERYLASIGVNSDVRFEALSFGAFTASVSIAPSTRPDFSIESVEATLGYPAVFGVPSIARVRLIRPFLIVTHDGEKLTFGALQPLVDSVSKGSGNGASPVVAIEDGTVLVNTTNGALQFTGNANIANGRVESLNANLQKTTLRGNGITADIGGGTVTAETQDGLLQVALRVNADTVAHGQDSARGVDVSARIRGLQWSNERGGVNFRFSGSTILLTTADVRVAQASAANSTTAINFNAMQGTFENEHIRATGTGTMNIALTDTHSSSAAAAMLSAQALLESATIDLSQEKLSIGGPIRMTASGAGVTYAMQGSTVEAGMIAVQLTSASGAGEYSRGVWSVAGPIRAAVDSMGVRYPLSGGAALGALHAEFDGPGRVGSTGLEATMKASLSANADLPAPAARELGRTVSGGDAEISAALASALRTVRFEARGASVISTNGETVFALNSPVAITGAGGARLALSARASNPLFRMRGDQTEGAFVLDTGGTGLPEIHLTVLAYRADGDAFAATAEFDARFSYAAFRGIHATGSANLRSDNRRTTLELVRCAEVGLESYGPVNAPFVRNAKSQLCSEAGRTVFTSQQSGWQMEGRLAGAAATIETLQSGISEGQGRIQLSGTTKGLQSLRLDMGQAVQTDLLKVPRFQPFNVTATAALLGQDLRSNLTIATRDQPFATVAIRHSTATGEGAADLEAKEVTFAPARLQPGQIAPLLGALGTRVSGTANFAGRIAWDNRGTTSNGHFTASGIGLDSPFGQVRRGNADVVFSSLLPIVAPAGQTFTAERVESRLPLEGVAAKFSLTQEELKLDSVTAAAAGGRVVLDPLTYSFAPGATTAGSLRIENVNLAPILAAAGLDMKMSADARIDGVVPFSTGPMGLRVTDGHIAANRPGRLSIKREALTTAIGTGAGAAAPPSAVQDFTYQAMEDLAFDRLEGLINSQPNGRLGMLFHIAGRHDPPEAREARLGVIDLLRGRAFDKPLPLPKGTPIDLTLDTSLNLDELLASYFARPSS